MILHHTTLDLLANSHLLDLIHDCSSTSCQLIHHAATICRCIGCPILCLAVLKSNLVDLTVLRQERVVCVPLDLIRGVEGGSVISGDGCIELISSGQIRVGNPGAAIANQVCVISLNGSNAILAIIPAVPPLLDRMPTMTQLSGCRSVLESVATKLQACVSYYCISVSEADLTNGS